MLLLQSFSLDYEGSRDQLRGSDFPTIRLYIHYAIKNR